MTPAKCGVRDNGSPKHLQNSTDYFLKCGHKVAITASIWEGLGAHTSWNVMSLDAIFSARFYSGSHLLPPSCLICRQTLHPAPGKEMQHLFARQPSWLYSLSSGSFPRCPHLGEERPPSRGSQSRGSRLFNAAPTAQFLGPVSTQWVIRSSMAPGLVTTPMLAHLLSA